MQASSRDGREGSEATINQSALYIYVCVCLFLNLQLLLPNHLAFLSPFLPVISLLLSLALPVNSVLDGEGDENGCGWYTITVITLPFQP